MTQHSSVSLFISYALADKNLLDKLETHLSPLKRQGIISAWHDRLIQPGSDRAQEIDAQLNQASVILLLVSADFLNSEYCYGVEMQCALGRQQAGEALVVPIILRPIDWHGAPFAHLQPLPTDAKPVTSWSNREEAFADIVTGLRKLIEKTTALSLSTSSTSFSLISNVPYPRNKFFTGREKLLEQLHDNLMNEDLSISGLGGIGKTQAALEYAYRYQDDYQYVLWVNAASRETFIASFFELARLLNLPEKNEKNQKITIEAMQSWFKQHDHWLLIVDGADEPSLARDFLPRSHKGHILLTTRVQPPGLSARKIEVEVMDKDEGMLFLLRRAGVLERNARLSQSSETDRTAAEKIVEEMGRLPLALDQAGAFIEETQCGVSGYLESYRKRRAKLLEWRGETDEEHKESVAATWSLSFEKVEKDNRMATDLLRVCAFLAPDVIPIEIFVKGASELGPHIKPLTDDETWINEPIRVLIRYSLVKRNSQEQTLSIHR